MVITRRGGGGRNTNASATAAISGSVISVTLTNAGSGYSAASPPTISFTGGSGTGAAATAAVASGTLTVTALGDKIVPNPAYSGPQATTPPYNQKTVNRHYGFGTSQGLLGKVTIAGVTAPIVSWSDTSITVQVPSITQQQSTCTLQQRGVSTATACGQVVITAANGKQSIDAVTVTIGGKAPTYVQVRTRLAMRSSSPSTGPLQVTSSWWVPAPTRRCS